jgi:hypothetical protein
MTRVNDAEITKPLRWIAPRNARSVAIENRLDEQSVVARRHAHIGQFAG